MYECENFLQHQLCMHGRPQGGKMGLCPPLETGTKKQKFVENLVSSLIPIDSLNSWKWRIICQYDTRSALEPGSLFWCHAVMSLQFTHVHFFACRGRLPKLAIGLFCCWVLLRNNHMAANLQTFNSSFGSVVGVLPHVTVELRRLGR